MNKVIYMDGLNHVKILACFIWIEVLTGLVSEHTFAKTVIPKTDPESVFKNPPEQASPGVLWMWMGSTISKQGITDDLEALKKAGFNRTTMFSLSDVTTPWAGEIQNSPSPGIVAWTEPWWKLVRFAASESKRLGMDFGMFNCPGYEASGGNWISPEFSMQEICWSAYVTGNNTPVSIVLKRPEPDRRSNMPWPVFNPLTGRVEKPEIEARRSFYKDIAVLAAPASGVVDKQSVLNLSDRMQADGRLEWEVPPGEWVIYRIGHTTTGALIQPAQWAATGLECDKMNPEAVAFHMDHVIGEIRKHLGDLVGNGFSHVHFDSYEAGVPTWTPRMREEFIRRRGYDLLPCLLNLIGRNVGGKQDSIRFRSDFDQTIRDLYRDVYFKTIREKLDSAGLQFLSEPYGGPWQLDDVMPMVGRVMTEFWTQSGTFTPYELEPTVAALRKSGQTIVEAEAFTGSPADSKWNETPAWLKPIGDAAFCAGVNRLVLHRFTHQPWDDKYKPGMAMGQWGTHFDRTQTWWNEMPALVNYWKRCQALLQWGNFDEQQQMTSVIKRGHIQLKSICRTGQHCHIFFVANTTRGEGEAECRFSVSHRQPELWDPLTGEIRQLGQFECQDGFTTVMLRFADAQSFFVVFRKAVKAVRNQGKPNFPDRKELMTIATPWQVQFDSIWGGPVSPIRFEQLEDWTHRCEPGIRYYSGTADYLTCFDLDGESTALNFPLILSLGQVRSVAHVILNGHDLGTVWTAPWEVKLPAKLLKKKQNKLEVRVTNVWANRLIGDHQYDDDCEWLPGHQGGRFLKRFPGWLLTGSPRPAKERLCFTTWDYFTSDSPLESSGLLGPVKLLIEK